MNSNDYSPEQIEFRMRFREAAAKIFKQKFGEHKADELVDRAKRISNSVFETVMQVVNLDASKGGKFDHAAAYQLCEKLYVDNMHGWSKDEMLFLCVLVQTGLTMERVKEMVDMGLTGDDKSGLL